MSDSQTKMAKINRFTRRELGEEEVYCFSAILCDNEIDRDQEKFSRQALEKLAELFIGKTGIFNHDRRAKIRPRGSLTQRWSATRRERLPTARNTPA